MNIVIQNLHHTYPGGVDALRGISLRIEAGEQAAIIGQNGAGKRMILPQTYVEPPQPSRLGKRLGFSETVISQDEFLTGYKKFIQNQ